MEIYGIIKTIHILSSTILMGTGLGIAFFMMMSYFTDDIRQKFYAARITVLADFVFTAPAVLIQPATGLWLIYNGGFAPDAMWLSISYGLYVLAGLCWLPVVWIQIQLKKMATASVQDGAPLPERYHRLFRLWFLLGWPAFLSLVIVFYMMVNKPV